MDYRREHFEFFLGDLRWNAFDDHEAFFAEERSTLHFVEKLRPHAVFSLQYLKIRFAVFLDESLLPAPQFFGERILVFASEEE